jgi:membrane protease YdiL (CAAX protease family)
MAMLIGQLHPVDLSVGFASGLSNEALEAIAIILMEGVFAVAGIITLVLTGKVIERRSLTEVGLGRSGLLGHTALGLGIGAGAALLYILMVILAVLVGVMDPSYSDLSTDWQPFGVFGSLGLILVFTCWVAVAEEVLFRGFLFRIVEEGLGSWLALAISALLFGMVHLPNFDDPSLLDVTSQMAGGVSLAAAYMLTRKLWLPIGIHWGWDLLIFATDGGNFVSALTRAWESGGGALETVLGVLPDLILSIVLLALVIRRGQIRTPRWMRRKRTTNKEPSIYNESTAP